MTSLSKLCGRGKEEEEEEEEEWNHDTVSQAITDVEEGMQCIVEDLSTMKNVNMSATKFIEIIENRSDNPAINDSTEIGEHIDDIKKHIDLCEDNFSLISTVIRMSKIDIIVANEEQDMSIIKGIVQYIQHMFHVCARCINATKEYIVHISKQMTSCNVAISLILGEKEEKEEKED